MRNSAPEFLAQNLMRATFEAQSFVPFTAPLTVMREATCLFRRADAYKAIMFGLAGIVFHGWESTVVTDIPSTSQDTSPYRHQFAPGIAETVQPSQEFKGMARQYYLSVGYQTVLTIGNNLEESARTYSEAAKGVHVHNGIDTHDAASYMRSVAAEVEGTDILTVPFAFVRNLNTHEYEPAFSPFRLRQLSGLAIAASNFTRFGILPIDQLMQGFVPPIPGHPAIKIPTDCTKDKLPGVVSRLMVDNLRASQRLDGVATRIQQTRVEKMSLTKNPKGGYCITWPGREAKPPQELCPYDTQPTIGPTHQAVLNRQKCVIGYTTLGETTMPGQRIIDAMLHHMHTNSLFSPEVFKRRAQVDISNLF